MPASLFHADLIGSTATTEWEPGLVFICRKASMSDPCDCGYDGPWEHRWVIMDNVKAGFDERCPGCGDIERFTLDAEQVDRYAEHGEVVAFRRRFD